jgi:hypothetical protein
VIDGWLSEDKRATDVWSYVINIIGVNSCACAYFLEYVANSFVLQKGLKISLEQSEARIRQTKKHNGKMKKELPPE